MKEFEAYKRIFPKLIIGIIVFGIILGIALNYALGGA